MAKPRSLRLHLIGLVVGVLLPMWVFDGVLLIAWARHEQSAMIAAARTRTHVAAAAIDHELTSLRGRLFLLAGELSLQTNDLSDFHVRARQAFDGMTVILTSPDGREILNTNAQYGVPLPDNPDMAMVRRVVETREAYTGDLTDDPVRRRPAVEIAVPVTRDSRLAYVLSLDVSSTLPSILRQADLPDGWVGAILDRQGRIIGRNRDPDRYVGQVARPAFLNEIAGGAEGVISGISLEGEPLVLAFAHTSPGGWAINVGIPRKTLMTPVHDTIGTLLLFGAVTLGMAVAAAILIGRRIAGPIAALVPAAEAVGRGEPAGPQTTGLIEVNEVARSLFEASKQLSDAAAERSAADAALRESERKSRVLAADLARIDEERNALLNRTIVAQQQERTRIARELHDGLAQYLTAMRLTLDRIQTEAKTGTASAELLADLNALWDELGQAVNSMTWELRPVALDDLGLSRAVGHYLEEWSERAHVPVDIEIRLGDRALPRAIETTLFRVLQEAASNVARHAGASRAGVILETRGDEVLLIVEDDGKGFPAEDPSAGTGRFGLIGMRERLALVHGEMDVESGPGTGTTLFVRIPIERRAEPP